MSKYNGRRYRGRDEDEQEEIYDDQLDTDTYEDDLVETYDDDQIDTDYDVPKYVPSKRSTGTRSRSRRRPPQRRQRRVWPWLLGGCLGGVVLIVLAAALVIFLALRSLNNGGSLGGIPGNSSNATNYAQQIPAQRVPLTAITQITVQDPIGNVTITEDASVTMPTVAATKRVNATSSDAANTAYSMMNVQVQPSTTPTPTLTVNATVPNTGGLLGNHNDAIDLVITLPPSSLTAATPVATSTSASTPTPLTLSLTLSIGNATVNGLSGILGIKDDIGSITVTHATLADGSHLQTSTGNVSFTGSLDLTARTGNTAPLFKLQSESGNIAVTLPATTNVILDANTNVGTISSDFPLNIQNSSGAANFYGPLLPHSPQGQPQAVLTLNVSTGAVSIHKT